MTEYIIQARSVCEKCRGQRCSECNRTGYTYRDVPLVDVFNEIVDLHNQRCEDIAQTKREAK